MKIKRQKIAIEELLIRYAAGERDFSRVIIEELKEGLLKDVDLSGINLEDSILIIDLSGATLKEANLRNTRWGNHCDWKETDFSGCDFTGINNESSCVFVRCNFSNTIWDKADLWQSTFEDCNLTDAKFDNAEFCEVDLYG